MASLTSPLAEGSLASDGTVFKLGTTLTSHVTAGGAFVITGGVKGQPLASTATASSAFSLKLKSKITYAEKAKASLSYGLGKRATMASHITATSTFAIKILPVMASKAKVSESYAPHVGYHLTQATKALAKSTLLYKNTRALASHATGTSTFAYTLKAAVALTSAATASSTWARTRKLHVTLASKAIGHDFPVMRAHYGVVWADVTYASIFVEPSNSSSIWVINTRTNAVTQYTNFKFNSAVCIGRKYVAADATGLYELDGAQDEGNQPVVALLGGGFINANGNKFAGIKGAYISAAGQGPGSASGAWGLTLTTGDGRSYGYQAQSNPGLMTSKINIGKGFKTANFSWKLTNLQGQDFDLNNIEFVPAISVRRVGG